MQFSTIIALLAAATTALAIPAIGSEIPDSLKTIEKRASCSVPNVGEGLCLIHCLAEDFCDSYCTSKNICTCVGKKHAPCGGTKL